MAAALDDELSPRRRRALDRHVERCRTCQGEMDSSRHLLTALAALPMDAPVSPQLEQATLRRVRVEAAEVAGRQSGAGTLRSWVFGLSIPAFAAAVVVVVAVMATMRAPQPAHKAANEVVAQAPRPTGDSGAHQARTAAPTSRVVARAARDTAVPVTASLPADVPPELAAAPELFMELPLLRNLEKLQHYDAILHATGEPSGERQTNG